MTKTKKKSSRKRGPKEERLIIRDDAAEAPVKLLRPGNATTTKLASLRKAFKKAHEDGMAGLENEDVNAFGAAIKRERDIINVQKELINAQKEVIERRTRKSTRRK